MDPLLEKLAAAVITTLCAVVIFLWKENRSWQTRWEAEHDKRIEDLKEGAETSERFVAALESLRSRSSDRPSRTPPSSH